MYRLWVNWRAKRKYVYRQEFENATNELNAKAAFYRAAASRREIERSRKEADGIDARIAQMTEMEERGFWECEDGHETTIHDTNQEGQDVCSACRVKPARFVKRSEMSPKEQYESDMERKEAEKVAAQKRQSAAEMEQEAATQDATAKNFMNQAKRGRAFADLLRKL